MDPQYWSNDNDYGHDAIESIIQNFKVPLEAAGFDKRKVFTEWRSLHITVRSFYPKESAVMLWEKLFPYKREVYQNILKLVELVLCLSSSNCEVECVQYPDASSIRSEINNEPRHNGRFNLDSR